MNSPQPAPLATSEMNSPEFPTGLVCGVPVQAARRADFVSGILTTIAEKRDAARAGVSIEPAYVATINSDFLANTRDRNSESARRLLKTLRAARFSTADGMPVVWLLRADGPAGSGTRYRG